MSIYALIIYANLVAFTPVTRLLLAMGNALLVWLNILTVHMVPRKHFFNILINI